MASPKKHLIWDLSGTLFKPSPQGMSPSELANYSFLFLMWSGKKEASRLDRIAFQVLEMLNEKFPANAHPSAYTHTGEPLPEIIRLYLAGTLRSEEALKITLDFFDTWAADALSSDDAQQVRTMLEILFNPTSLVRCMKPISAVVELMSRSVDKKISHSILSNWDHDSFVPFYAAFQNSVLAPFARDAIVISADTGFVKPQPQIFEWLITHKHLNPQDCLFIDDQKENVAAAVAVGIEALHITISDLEPVKKTLESHNFI